MRQCHTMILRKNFPSWILLICFLLPNMAIAQEESAERSKSTPSKSVRIYRTPEERREAGYGYVAAHGDVIDRLPGVIRRAATNTARFPPRTSIWLLIL